LENPVVCRDWGIQLVCRDWRIQLVCRDWGIQFRESEDGKGIKEEVAWSVRGNVFLTLTDL
jgi:hypothetical protein